MTQTPDPQTHRNQQFILMMVAAASKAGARRRQLPITRRATWRHARVAPIVWNL